MNNFWGALTVTAIICLGIGAIGGITALYENGYILLGVGANIFAFFLAILALLWLLDS